MAGTPAHVVHQAGVWVDQAAAALAAREAAAKAAEAAQWHGFVSWYDEAAVAAIAAKSAQVSAASQDAVSGAMRAYIAHLVALLNGTRSVPVPKIGPLTYRKGADPVTVHSRPAAEYRWQYAMTADQETAFERAVARGQQLVQDDLMLAARDSQQAAMEKLNVTRYRRVPRPELAKTGLSCGLCVATVDQTYSTADLMPMHTNCHCLVVPVTDMDPAKILNDDDLARLYAAAGESAGVGGSTRARDLKNVRVAVNEHGELGPILTVRGQHFTTEKEARQTANPKAQLDTLLTNLATFQKRAKDGQNMADPIAYQKRQIARLERLAA